MAADFAVIVANGEFSASPLQIEEMRQAKLLIAVDGGIEHCVRLKLRPHLLVGDFDSASQEALAFFADVPRKILPHDKDVSDLEIAMEMAFQQTTGPIGVFGATGGRTDHLLYNLYLLSRYPGRAAFESERERLFCIQGRYSLMARPGQTLSLLPINGPVEGVTTRGLEWNLDDATFDKEWMSLSNVCVKNEVEISVRQGDLICCVQIG